MTDTEYENGTASKIWCLLLLPFFCTGCCCLCMNSCKDVRHICSKCRKDVGTSKSECCWLFHQLLLSFLIKFVSNYPSISTHLKPENFLKIVYLIHEKWIAIWYPIYRIIWNDFRLTSFYGLIMVMVSNIFINSSWLLTCVNFDYPLDESLFFIFSLHYQMMMIVRSSEKLFWISDFSQPYISFLS